MEKKAVSGIMLQLLLIGTLMLAFNIQQAESSEHRTIIVPDDYEKIQWALGNASDGDTIYVRAGVYNENITYPVTYPYAVNLALVGENKSDTLVNGSIVFDAHARIAEFGGYTIHELQIMGELSFIAGRNCTISDTVVHSGVTILEDAAITVRNSLISGQITVAAGTHYWPTWQIDITNNTLSGSGVDIWGWAFDITVSKNRIFDAAVGIASIYSVFGRPEYFFIGNNFSNCGKGVSISWMKGQSRSVFVSENTFVNNTYGVYFEGQWEPWMSPYAKLFHNNFINSPVQAEVSNSSFIWDDGYPSGGNYWSDYADVDLFNGPNQDLSGMDGLWDHPYTIDADNRDRYPLVKPWPIIPANVDVDPDTLNLRGKEQWITAYIELPEGYNVSNIDVNSILLNDTVPVDAEAPVAIGDYDCDTIPDLMVKFSRAAVISYIRSVIKTPTKFSTVTLSITGMLNDGTIFKGNTAIRIIYLDIQGLGAKLQRCESYIQRL